MKKINTFFEAIFISSAEIYLLNIFTHLSQMCIYIYIYIVMISYTYHISFM